MVVMVGMVLVFILETAGIVHLVAPSYQGEQLALAVELTRILLPSMIFGTLMGVLVGINNVNNSFLAPSLIGLVANVITYKHGLRFRFEIDFSHPGLRETLRLVAPFLLSAAAGQVNLIVDRTLATGLPAGSGGN